MQLTVLVCLVALAFNGLEAASPGRSKGGASMQTSYVGKLHETNAHGKEECIGTFSGSNTFEQPAECCWSSFAEKCKELLGGLVNILSSTTSCNPCGCGKTCIDLDMKSRITKDGCQDCETPVVAAPQAVVVKQPVYKQVVYKPTDHCDDCEPHHPPAQPLLVRQPVQPVVVPQPVYQPIIEQVRVLPVQEACDDCDVKHKHKKDECDDCVEEKKHKHHHKHHKHHHKQHHHHKHHKKDSKCEDGCD